MHMIKLTVNTPDVRRFSSRSTVLPRFRRELFAFICDGARPLYFLKRAMPNADRYSIQDSY